MSSFFQLDVPDWFTGTDDLTLEQEAAYLRIVAAINLYDQPIRDNLRVLAGLWRCNERKAKRLREELIAAEKIWIEGGSIFNERAVEDVSNRLRLRIERASSGRRGGIESGKSRLKALKTNKTGEAPASTIKEDNIREDIPPLTPPRGGGKKKTINEFEEWYQHYPRKVAKGAARKAFAKARKSVPLEALIAGAKTYAAKCAGKEREYIAHPATWLNAERWADEAQGGKSGNGSASLEARVSVAKDWLSRNDDIPTWMDRLDTAEALVNEGFEYDRLRKAGFSLPPRGRVVDIGEAMKELGEARRVSGD